MANTNTTIEWTDATWSPVTGCQKVSQGCKHCYAETIADRFWATQYPPNADGSPRRFTDVRIHPDRLDQPLGWKKPRMVFVNSMSDLFHEDVPDDFIAAVWGVMACAPQHTFQVLTKRPERMRALLNDSDRWVVSACEQAWQWVRKLGLPDGGPPENYLCTPEQHDAIPALPNVWLGVSVEDQATADERIPALLDTPAAVRFVSYEPALGPVDFRSTRGAPIGDWLLEWEHGPRLGWVIVGGESGPGARPFNLAWARDTIRQCREAGVACFVKQMGSRPVILPGDDITGYEGIYQPITYRDRKGGDISEFPEDLRVREFPRAPNGEKPGEKPPPSQPDLASPLRSDAALPEERLERTDPDLSASQSQKVGGLASPHEGGVCRDFSDPHGPDGETAA